jgi:hypothetical protein
MDEVENWTFGRKPILARGSDQEDADAFAKAPNRHNETDAGRAGLLGGSEQALIHSMPATVLPPRI